VHVLATQPRTEPKTRLEPKTEPLWMKCMGLGTCEESMPMPKMNHGKFTKKNQILGILNMQSVNFRV
jgi:hypothetical protein